MTSKCAICEEIKFEFGMHRDTSVYYMLRLFQKLDTCCHCQALKSISSKFLESFRLQIREMQVTANSLAFRFKKSTTIIQLISCFSNVGGESQTLIANERIMAKILETLASEIDLAIATDFREISVEQKEIITLKEQLAKANEDKQREINELKEQLAKANEDKQTEISKLEAQMTKANEDKQTEISKLEAQMTKANEDKQKEINELKEQLVKTNEAKQMEIKELKERIVKTNNFIRQYAHNLLLLGSS